MNPEAPSLAASSASVERFDDIVIGSSPLMLLQAGLLARAGRRVCLLDRETRLGGSWQTAVLDTGDEVEIACHLIEVFPGVYELLQELSGTPFVALDAQPIRVHRSGIIVPYFSRLLMLASGARLMLGWASAKVNWALGRAEDRNRLINFEKKLSSYLRHQGRAFFQRPIMQGPKFGFVEFMERLIARCRAEGAEIRLGDVTALDHKADGLWDVTCASGALLRAEHVHCTTSTNLRPVATGQLRAVPQDFAHRLCVVAEVPNDLVKTSQTYVAFWNDPSIARISRIDMPRAQPFQRFLVEFHDPDLQANPDWQRLVCNQMERAKIVASGGDVRILGHVDCPFTTNVDQLPTGKIDTNLWGYYSSGNLAAGLAAWQKTDRLPKLTQTAT